MNIVCAVDGSEYSEWGVQTLRALAARAPQHVTFVHVIDAKSRKSKTPSPAKRALRAMEKAGRLILRQAERSANIALGQAATGSRTTFHRVLAYGPIAPTIAQHTHRAKADLVLMGSRGVSDIKGFLLGSTSRQVAAMAPCSVFVVKQPLSNLGRVTLAVDDSRASRVAAQFLRAYILSDQATVTILSSAESPVSDLAVRYLSASQLSALMQPVIERTNRLVNVFRDDFIKDGWTATTKTQMDHVIDTIIKHVEAEGTDLLVVGARRLTKGERLHLGSVSETLLRHAPCSILIARQAHERLF